MDSQDAAAQQGFRAKLPALACQWSKKCCAAFKKNAAQQMF
jgi:hypothetical protein